MPLVFDGTAGTIVGVSSGGLPANTITSTQIAANTVTSSQLATGSVEGYIQNTSSSFGFRNILHNGAMQIDQHNAGANTSATYGSVSNYGLDRWQVNNYSGTTSNSIYFQQVADAPPGFYQSLKVQCTNGVATSSNSTGRRNISQYVEGLNIQHLNWGTSNAKPVTLSFWVKSSLTGTFAISLEEVNTTAASYVTTYNITQANTWQYFVFNIPGPTISTWSTNSSGSLAVWFDIGQGSSISASSSTQLNSWQAADYRGYINAVHIGDTSGATFQVTGVQLELGNQATPYEHRPYGVELAICQRYFWNFNSATQGGSYMKFGMGTNINTTLCRANFVLPVQMRAVPNITYSGASTFAVSCAAGDIAVSSISLNPNIGTNLICGDFTVGSASLVSGGSGCVEANGTTGAYILVSAEL